MIDMKDAAQTIERYVRPDTFPLAIRVERDPSKIPEKAKRPKRDLGASLSICQGISIARRYGWTMAMGGEDLSCPIAQVAFGFEPPSPTYAKGTLAAGMYVKDEVLGQKTEAEIPRTPEAEAGVVISAPLAKATFEPEVVLVYGNSAQVMVMVAAALWKTGGSLTSSFTARADCADIINRTRQTGKPQVILPCYGDRVFGQTQDHEMAFSLPGSDLEAFLEGLEGCSKGGIRYPVPHYLRYQAHYPETYERVMKEFDEARASKP